MDITLESIKIIVSDCYNNVNSMVNVNNVNTCESLNTATMYVYCLSQQYQQYQLQKCEDCTASASLKTNFRTC